MSSARIELYYGAKPTHDYLFHEPTCKQTAVGIVRGWLEVELIMD